jgi:hypothetical protein
LFSFVQKEGYAPGRRWNSKEQERQQRRSSLQRMNVAAEDVEDNEREREKDET